MRDLLHIIFTTRCNTKNEKTPGWHGLGSNEPNLRSVAGSMSVSRTFVVRGEHLRRAFAKTRLKSGLRETAACGNVHGKPRERTRDPRRKQQR